MDRSEYLREIKENIEYPFLCQQFKFETYFDTAAIRRKRIENTSARAGNSFLLITAMW